MLTQPGAASDDSKISRDALKMWILQVLATSILENNSPKASKTSQRLLAASRWRDFHACYGSNQSLVTAQLLSVATYLTQKTRPQADRNVFLDSTPLWVYGYLLGPGSMALQGLESSQWLSVTPIDTSASTLGLSTKHSFGPWNKTRFSTVLHVTVFIDFDLALWSTNFETSPQKAPESLWKQGEPFARAYHAYTRSTYM